MISELIEMLKFVLNKNKACKITLHIAPSKENVGFISKIEAPQVFKLQDWKKNLK